MPGASARRWRPRTLLALSVAILAGVAFVAASGGIGPVMSALGAGFTTRLRPAHGDPGPQLDPAPAHGFAAHRLPWAAVHQRDDGEPEHLRAQRGRRRPDGQGPRVPRPGGPRARADRRRACGHDQPDERAGRPHAGPQRPHGHALPRHRGIGAVAERHAHPRHRAAEDHRHLAKEGRHHRRARGHGEGQDAGGDKPRRHQRGQRHVDLVPLGQGRHVRLRARPRRRHEPDHDQRDRPRRQRRRDDVQAHPGLEEDGGPAERIHLSSLGRRIRQARSSSSSRSPTQPANHSPARRPSSPCSCRASARSRTSS